MPTPAVLAAGQLTQRCTLQAPQTGQDGAGQPLVAWVDVANVWADVRHTSGLEAIKAGAATSLVQTSIRVRARPDLSAALRAVVAGQAYQVLAVLPDRSGVYADLVCQAIT